MEILSQTYGQNAQKITASAAFSGFSGVISSQGAKKSDRDSAFIDVSLGAAQGPNSLSSSDLRISQASHTQDLSLSRQKVSIYTSSGATDYQETLVGVSSSDLAPARSQETTSLVVAAGGVAVEIKRDGHLLQRIPDGSGYSQPMSQIEGFYPQDSASSAASLGGSASFVRNSETFTTHHSLGAGEIGLGISENSAHSQAYMGQSISVFA